LHLTCDGHCHNMLSTCSQASARRHSVCCEHLIFAKHISIVLSTYEAANALNEDHDEWVSVAAKEAHARYVFSVALR
jgi:hypothetical protein